MINNESLKLNDPTLGGSIGETLLSPETARFSEDDEQFLKFHGIYQQDDRDKRKIPLPSSELLPISKDIAGQFTALVRVAKPYLVSL